MWTVATTSSESLPNWSNDMRLSLTLLLCLLLAGCGGGGNDSSDPGASSIVAARPTLATDSSAEVAIQWAAPLDVSGANILEYQIFRGGSRIAAIKPTELSYRDNAAETSFTYFEISRNQLTEHTANHSALRPNETTRYQVHALIRRVDTGGVTIYEDSTLNSPGVATTPLQRPQISVITPEPTTALVRFSKLAGADQYQVELSAFEDFRSKVVRGPVIVTSDDGLITIPWPADSVAGGQIYCRVGARATRDASPPLTTDPNGDDFIYSPAQIVSRPSF